MGFTGFEGEDNRVCHSVRDGTRFARGTVEEDFDVVIVGAGVSGLTSAYKLKDKKVKILEKEGLLGGASKRGNWNGIYYSYGTADTGPSYEIELEGKRINYLEQLYKELEIPWRKVADPSDAFMSKDRLILNLFDRRGSYAEGNKDAKDFESAFAHLDKLLEKYGKPVIPIEACSREWAELDKKNLREMFVDSGAFFLSFLERYSKSTFGAPASEISAFEGLYYLSREREERYACPGGNASVSEALARRLEGRIELKATVAQIEQEKDLCYVTYVDGNGVSRTVRSRSVIMACPKQYAPYIIKGLPEDRATAFRRVRYDSFIVANVCTENAFYDSAFATYFDDTIFTDMTVADWMVTDGKKMANKGEPEVYTLYCPMGEKGRSDVLTKPAESWIRQILKGLEEYFPGVERRIADIKLFRYGHHYVLGYPGFATGPRTVAKKPFGNIYFAKDDIQGIPCLESAVWSGIDAASKLREKLG